MKAKNKTISDANKRKYNNNKALHYVQQMSDGLVSINTQWYVPFYSTR